MTSANLFNITTVFYMLSMLAFFVFLAGRNNKVGLSGSILAWAGFAVQTVAIGLRWKESYDMGMGHAPLSNLYESVIFFAWSIVLIFGLIDAKYKYRVIGAFVMPFALFSIAWAQMFTIAEFVEVKTGSQALQKLVIMKGDISPLMPALQSNWLTYHVITCFLGYAAFTVACGVSIMYLIKDRKSVV